jgi:AcrR family transcriptional regulator
MSKRDDILDAALALIVEGGVQSITFSKLFKLAKTGAGTFYHYFADKNDLVVELFKRCAKHSAECIMQDPGQDASAYQRFRAVMFGRARFCLMYPDDVEFITRYVHYSILPEDLRDHHMPTAQYVNAVIRNCQDEGLIIGLPTMMLAELTSGMVIAAIRGARNYEYELSDAEITQLVEMVWKAIKI